MIFFINKQSRQKATKHTRRIQEAEKQRGKPKKTSPTPKKEASHSKKPISEVISSPMYKLFQLHKLDTKECFSLCTVNVPFLLAMWLLSFQTIQKIQRRTEIQVFLLFFPTKEPFQLSNMSLTSLGKTQETPTRERMISHRGQTTKQWSRM